LSVRPREGGDPVFPSASFALGPRLRGDERLRELACVERANRLAVLPSQVLQSRPTGSPAMWMRNCWQVIAFANEIGATPLARLACNEPVVLFRIQSGEAVALADRCPHRLAPLSLGRVVGDHIQCGYHGMCFDHEGSCVRVPGQEEVPARARVRKYPLVERHTFAWIWLGDAALADPALVPDFHWMDDPAWGCVSGYHHFAANYQLVN